MNFRRFFLLFSFLLSFVSLLAQVEEPVNFQKEKEKKTLSKRFVFGGDFGLSFGTITYIKMAPVVGYKITDRITAGLGPIYIYEKYKNYDLETSTYGGKAVLSFIIIKESGNADFLGLGDIVLHAENEVINVETLYYDTGTYSYFFDNRIWIDNLLLGGGISQNLGSSFRISLYILWDVTQNEYSPYYNNNPIVKIGFSF